ncbi:MAG: cyclic nucleotide-gated ion channel [Pseudomonadota bacterium]
MPGERTSRRRRAYRALFTAEGGRAKAAFEAGLIALILASVTVAVVETFPGLSDWHRAAFARILLFAAFCFALEWGLRLWLAAEDERYARRGPRAARFAYLVSVAGIVDVLSCAPFFLEAVLGYDLAWLHIVPIFKLLRFSTAFEIVIEAIRTERRMLASAAVLMFVLLVFQSSVVYLLEREAQPDKYASIPEAMWWGIVTLTTVGYGDVTPVTGWGKLVGGITAVLGLAMFALPVGILASAFVEAVRRREFVVTWNLVASVPFFSVLDAKRIADIAGLLRTRQAAPGERLVRKDDVADSMFFIVAGEVEVDLAPRKVGLAAGDFFGEIALIADRRRTATVTATTPCKILVLQKSDFHAFMDANPALAKQVGEIARRRLAEIEGPKTEG